MAVIDMSNKKYYILLILTVFLACDRDEDIRFHSKGKNADIRISRFEKDLFQSDIYSINDSIPTFRMRYKEFLPLYGNKIIEIGDPKDSIFGRHLQSFVTDYTIHNVYKRVMEVFPDLTGLSDQLSEVFGVYHYFFPDKPIPQFVTCISGFNQSIVTDESLVVICLDKYLGEGEELYKMLYPPLPQYMLYMMNPQRVPVDVLRAWITTEYPFNEKNNNLLSQMIYEGRAMFCLRQLMPDISDTLLWGFTPNQLKFCKSNEKQMWTFLVENKLLFKNDRFTINQYVREAPFTRDFSNESPGRASVWLGYKIIISYVKQNKKATLSNLMEEKDYLRILNIAKYNP